MNLNENNTLGEWAAAYSSASRVFIRNNMDFCCGGAQALKDACDSNNIASQDIIKEIVELSANGPAPRWNEMELNELIDEILESFHKKHREDLGMLIPLAQKVERVHADKDDCPKGLEKFLQKLVFELESHMQKEEQILFPMIKSGQGFDVSGPVSVMMSEHLDHGENLAKLKTIAFNFVAPEGACGTWRTLYEGLATLERDIMEHISIENNILFPKVTNLGIQEGSGSCCGSCS